MNPLLMEDILDDLFKKLTIGDLKTCRSVCQLWDKRIVAHLKLFWRELHIIDFIDYAPKRFSEAMCDSKNKKLFRSFEGYVNLISKLGTKFFSEHEPKHLHLHIRSNEGEFKHEDLINILRLSAKYLEQISFDGTYIYAYASYGINNMDNLIDFTFPNLRTIRYCILQNSANAEGCVEMNQILTAIIKNCPNLKSIENPGVNFTISSSEIMSSNMLQNLTKMIISFRKYTARFQNYQDCQDLLKIQNQGLKLKYLDIKYEIDNRRGEIEKRTIKRDLWAIEKFIQGQSGSLETLMIKVKCDYQIKFRAVFSKLKKLAIGILHSSFETRLDLSNQFPQLEDIFVKIYCKKIVKWKKLFCGSGLKVHSIQLRNCNDRSKYDGEYRDLEMLFPHVVNLQIGPLEKNSLKYEGFGKFWSKSIKTISIIDQIIANDKKFFKIFSGLKMINFINTNESLFSASKHHWKRDFELLESFENLKFVKFGNLLVNQSDLTELGKKYIVDYIPAGKFRNCYYLSSYHDDWQNGL